MLAFLLGLLKIIGIVLLVILLVVLVLVAIVLFVPIRYQAEGTIDEEKKQAKARVTWLCKLVRLKLDYRFPDKRMLFLFRLLHFIHRRPHFLQKKLLLCQKPYFRINTLPRRYEHTMTLL